MGDGNGQLQRIGDDLNSLDFVAVDANAPLVIGRIAGPGGGTPTKPVGLVYIAFADSEGVEVLQTNWPADRSSIKLRSAKSALNLLRLRLLKQTRNPANPL